MIAGKGTPLLPAGGTTVRNRARGPKREDSALVAACPHPLFLLQNADVSRLLERAGQSDVGLNKLFERQKELERTTPRMMYVYAMKLEEVQSTVPCVLCVRYIHTC